jgi:DNA polymerase family A
MWTPIDCLSQWHRDCWRQVRTVPQPKEIRTPGFRRRLINGGTDFNNFTDLTNTPIQGGCADAVKMAILALEAELPSGTGIVAMLHDELVIETDTSIAEEMLTLAKRKMEESPDWYLKTFRCSSGQDYRFLEIVIQRRNVNSSSPFYEFITGASLEMHAEEEQDYDR